MSFLSSFLHSLSLSDSRAGEAADSKQQSGAAVSSTASSSSAAASSSSSSPAASPASPSDLAASSSSSSASSTLAPVAEGNAAAASVASSVSSSPSSNPHVPNGFVFACSLESLPVNGRRCLSLNSRAVVVYRVKPKSAVSSPLLPAGFSNVVDSDRSELLTLDAICYHMGVRALTETAALHSLLAALSPLAHVSRRCLCAALQGPLVDADIEELGGSPVAVCQWHHYRISMRSGEGLYQALGGGWKSKGVRQRTHPTLLSNGSVYVKVEQGAAQGGSKLDSDLYCDRPVTVEEVEAKEAKRMARGAATAAAEQKKWIPSGMRRG